MTDAPSTIPPNDEKIACLAASVAGRVDFPRGESSNIPLAKPDVILIFASMRPAFILSNILACVLPVFAYSLNASQAVRKADCERKDAPDLLADDGPLPDTRWQGTT